jgi:hypothetical protein
MKPEVRIELTRQLEAMRYSPEGANSRWLFAIYTIAELLAGVWLISWSFRLTIQAVSDDRHYWMGYSILLLGIIALTHAAYLTFNRSTNRKFRVLCQAVLDTTSTDDR